MSEYDTPAPPRMYQTPGPDIRPTSGLAVTSMVLGILFLCLGPLALLPLILGIIGITTTGANGQKKGQGFAIAGTALGGVGLMGTCLSIGILLPAIGAARQQAALIVSETQMRSIIQGCIMYADDHNGQFPPTASWEQDLVNMGLVDAAMFVSPGEDGDGVSYFYLGGENTFDATQIVLYEDPDHFPRSGVIVGFADNHVEEIPFDIFEQMLADQISETEAQP